MDEREGQERERNRYHYISTLSIKFVSIMGTFLSFQSLQYCPSHILLGITQNYMLNIFIFRILISVYLVCFYMPYCM